MGLFSSVSSDSFKIGDKVRVKYRGTRRLYYR